MVALASTGLIASGRACTRDFADSECRNCRDSLVLPRCNLVRVFQTSGVNDSTMSCVAIQEPSYSSGIPKPSGRKSTLDRILDDIRDRLAYSPSDHPIRTNEANVRTASFRHLCKPSSPIPSRNAPSAGAP
ncbi:hypothetical protein SCHPADRAFT_401836 [Schizopora paradoxa]|uniref:Uncharacterized protein n=1 Tax=Schizopora paradoxa TaxID=27342 RepID=A0A0H2RLE4_9AGAM|nr:hypothetical protein SCHPADRAFT_401836 [Schizopora paradoxa]